MQFDVKRCPELAARLNISGFPRVVLIHGDGRTYRQFPGVGDVKKKAFRMDMADTVKVNAFHDFLSGGYEKAKVQTIGTCDVPQRLSSVAHL